MTDALSTPTQPAASSPVVTTDEGQAKGLTLDSVTLTFADGDRSFNALDDVNLRVAPGEIVAIVGPSGAGKSSLLAVAGGLTMPTSGRVEVDGIEVSSLAARALARFRRDHIGFVFQTSNLVPALTAIDQLRLVEKITGRRSSRTPAELLEQVGMSEHAKRRPGRLSGGERQRVGIARALASDPSVLLVDEPTAALDRKRSHEIVALLAQGTRTAGVATVMVTHDHDILGQCDRVLEMLDGRLTETGASTH